MLACDFFAVTAEMIGPFDYVYDRGALVALPADIRYVCEAKVVQHLSRGKYYNYDYIFISIFIGLIAGLVM